MLAIIQDSYGPPEVLRLEEVASPTPKVGEVLVRVHAAGLCGDDWHLMQGIPLIARLELGLRKPKARTPGLEFAGVIESIGPDVAKHKIGERVFGWGRGAFAEQIAVPVGQIYSIPDKLTFNEAAALPISGFTALQAIKDVGKLEAKQRVLILGASGGVGHYAVQIAKELGAEVWGVASGANLDFVRELGADHVIDYSREDPTQLDQQFDLVIDLAGVHPLKALRRVLTPRGTLVLIGSSGAKTLRGRNRWFKGVERWIQALLASPFTKQRLKPLVHQDRHADLVALSELVERGALRVHIDQVFALADTANAIRYSETRRARGKVVIQTVD